MPAGNLIKGIVYSQIQNIQNKNPEFGLIIVSGFYVLDLGINDSTYQITSWHTSPYGYRLYIAGDFQKFPVKITRINHLVLFKIAF